VRAPQASRVSARVALLIARHHGGDRRAAARTLGIAPEGLAGLLSGDWCRFSLDDLAALIRGHDVSVGWLLGSEQAARPRWPSSTAADQQRALETFDNA
jgi:hypothetical protein